MEIRRIRTRNFLSFGKNDVSLDFLPLNIMVGPNASGKTNLLRAIAYVGDTLKTGRFGPDLEYYHAGGTRESFEVEVALTLDGEEAGALADYLVSSPLVESVSPKEGETQPAVQQFAFEAALRLRETFTDIFRNISLIVKGTGKEHDTPEKFLEFTVLGRAFYAAAHQKIVESTNGKPSIRMEYLSRLIADATRELNSKPATHSRPAMSEKDKITLPSGEPSGNKVLAFIIQSFDERELDGISLNSVVPEEIERARGHMPHLRRLGAFLQSRGFKERYVDFFRILDTIYNSSVVCVSEMRTRPEPYAILPQNLDELAQAKLSGRELPALLFHLKNSPKQAERDRYLEIQKRFQGLTGESFDVVLRTESIGIQEPAIGWGSRGIPLIVHPPGSEEATHRTEGFRVEAGSDTYLHRVGIMISSESSWIPLEFSAAGIFELLILLSALVGQKRKILLLDEPALNLHPTKQIEIRALIEESSKSGNQVVVVTHSPFLISLDNAGYTWRFVKEDGETRVIQLGTHPELKTLRKHLGGAVGDTIWGEILFATGVVLVEGPSDKYAIERFDIHLGEKGAGLQDDNWPVIIAGSKESFPALMGLCMKLDVHLVVLTDYDGIMDCNSKISCGQTMLCVPGLFGFLLKNRQMQSDDLALLRRMGTVEVKNRRCYEDQYFRELEAMARRYGIFALPTRLEEVLGVKKARRGGKYRGVLEAVEGILRRDEIPPIFQEFLAFIRHGYSHV